MKKWFIIISILALAGVWKYWHDPYTITSPQKYQLHYKVKVHKAIDQSRALPMVIALHGSGDNLDNFATLFDTVNLPIRFVIFEGPFDFSSGHTWISGQSPAQNAKDTVDIADSIAGALPELTTKFPTLGKPAVMGVSIGAIQSYTLALQHPEDFSYLLPISGFMYPELLPKRRQSGSYPEITAYHYAQDPLVSFSKASSTVANLNNIGITAKLIRYEEKGHFIVGSMWADFQEKLEDIAYDLLP